MRNKSIPKKEIIEQKIKLPHKYKMQESQQQIDLYCGTNQYQ